jgi:hypothetical protein
LLAPRKRSILFPIQISTSQGQNFATITTFEWTVSGRSTLLVVMASMQRRATLTVVLVLSFSFAGVVWGQEESSASKANESVFDSEAGAEQSEKNQGSLDIDEPEQHVSTSAEELSASGESCAKSADCAAGLRCIDQTCIDPEKGRRLHDSFYLRMNVGVGYLNSDAEDDITLSGIGPALGIMIGGTPTPGFTIGGGIWFDSVSSPTAERGGTSVELDGTVVQGIIGPFVDIFPDPSEGFHVGALIGFAKGSNPSAGIGSPLDGGLGGPHAGVGGGPFAGYDFWVSVGWTLGGMVRASLAPMSSSDVTTRNIAVFFTGLYQ